jgi:hypothetical protein
MKGLQMVAGTHRFVATDSYLTGGLAALVVLAFLFSRRVPAALVLFGGGLALATVTDPATLGFLARIFHPKFGI